MSQKTLVRMGEETRQGLSIGRALVSTTTVLSLATLAGAEGTRREKIKERVAEKMKEVKEQAAGLRQAVADFFAAKDAGDREAALAAVQKARQAWQAFRSTNYLALTRARSGG